MVCGAALFFAAFLVSCTSPTRTLQRYEFQQPQMGLPFRMVLYAPDRASADTASSNAFARIKQLNDVMSDYEFDSELSTLSRSSGEGKAVPVSDDLWFVLERSQRLAHESGG
ncbi:MAG TPA: FAD:protein FMN transferase, partial [Candidatus Limnocylindria bacterium]|nr:FAD:protein FMN transferase [Candidatus Limnocylindria bacterium]